MISNRFRLLVLLILLAALTVFSACRLLPESNLYDSEVTIKNIENPEHVEEFTLTAQDPEDDHIAELNSAEVENNELKYTFTSLIGASIIELEINNNAIDSGYYEEFEEPKKQTVYSSETDATFELIFTSE